MKAPTTNIGERLRKQVRWIAARYPDAWERADVRRKAGKGTWPDWCYLPNVEWWEIARPHWKAAAPTVENVMDVGRIIALGTWRVTQGIYRFDPDLYAALIDTPLNDRLPESLLYRLPAWCVYLETPGITYGGDPLIGVYAHLNQRFDGHTDLRLLFDTEGAFKMYSMPIRLGLGSLAAALEAVITEADAVKAEYPQIEPHFDRATVLDEIQREDAHDLQPILSLLLYLCADEADYSRNEPPQRSYRVREHKIPTATTIYDVGTRIGAGFRKVRQDYVEQSRIGPEGTRPPVIPHWRKAHWHLYWTGPKSQPQEARVKWLQPIPVGMNEGEELQTAIHPVRVGC